MNPINLNEWFNIVQRDSAIIEFSPYQVFNTFLNKKVWRKKLSFISILSEKINDLTVSFLTSLGE